MVTPLLAIIFQLGASGSTFKIGLVQNANTYLSPRPGQPVSK